MSKGFIDKLRIFVKAGTGAAGNPAVRGKGGNGGNVYLEVRDDYSLAKLLESNPSKRFKAASGLEASKRRGHVLGKDGKDLVIPVPPGISVYVDGQGNSEPQNSKGGFTPRKLGDLDTPKQRLLIAQGGLGGIQQTGYIGSAGQSHAIVLDLKLMADYSLLGFPNAGKSSLLRALSGANVKIASYPFTTIQPKLAHCKYADGRMISLTDLPGLADIYARYPDAGSSSKDKDASDHVSLPALRHTNFLKHVERSSCLLLVLDALGFRRDQYSPWRSPLASTYIVMHLLERWSGGSLLEKPMVCVINKIDTPGADEAIQESLPYLERVQSDESRSASGLPPELLPRFVPQFENIHQISALKGTNIPELKESLRRCLDEIKLRECDQSLAQIADAQRKKEEKLLFDRDTVYC
ncbi:unnamed protein product [Calicophoron daubneyi]|uniref:GTP-binding protein 10 n=1 Tax=Calicophoron daubneyi TaxID=300641 RepID=A0AAV2TXC5_CALDB